MTPTKSQFIKRIQQIAFHKNALSTLKKKKPIKLEDIPDVSLAEFTRKK